MLGQSRQRCCSQSRPNKLDPSPCTTHSGKCACCAPYCTSTSSCPRNINCSPEYVRRRVVVSCRGLLGQRRLYVYSETSETAAPVSSSITRGWVSICNGTSNGLISHPAIGTVRTPHTFLPGLQPFLLPTAVLLCVSCTPFPSQQIHCGRRSAHVPFYCS